MKFVDCFSYAFVFWTMMIWECIILFTNSAWVKLYRENIFKMETRSKFTLNGDLIIIVAVFIIIKYEICIFYSVVRVFTKKSICEYPWVCFFSRFFIKALSDSEFKPLTVNLNNIYVAIIYNECTKLLWNQCMTNQTSVRLHLTI